MPLTDFRAAVQTALSDALGIPFVHAKLEGPIAEREVGCCWSIGVQEVEGNVTLQQLAIGARIFKRHLQRVDPEEAEHNAEALEQLAADIQTAFQPEQTTLGPWYARATSVELSHELQAVEVSIVGVEENPAV